MLQTAPPTTEAEAPNKPWFDPEPEFRRRIRMLDAANKSLELRQALYAQSARDLVFWVNNFCWAHDPRLVPSHLPMTMFPKQVEYLHWRRDRRRHKQDGLIEKSRDMGATVLACCDQIHYFLFTKDFKGMFGTRKEDMLDQLGNPDTIFQRLRYIMQYLPWWMLPVKMKDKFRLFVNEDNGSVIVGEVGDQIGRGGRSTIADVDEFAYIERAELIKSALSQNSNTTYFTSTPNGIGDVYYQMRFGGQIPVYTFQYTDHPGKTEAWLERQKAKYDPIIIAREILIDYTASAENVLIPAEWVKAAIDFDLPVVNGDRVAGLDISDDGGNWNVLIIREGNRVRQIEAWRQGTTTQTAHKAKLLCEQARVEVLNYDRDGVGAGVAGTLGALDEEEKLSFQIVGLRGGGKVTGKRWPSFGDRQSADLFFNRRAEMYWTLRCAFERTHEMRTQNIFHPNEDLISIPNDPELIAQLSQPKYNFSASGLIQVESKQQMLKRGLKSPDRSDSCAYCFAQEDTTTEDFWKDFE